MIPETTVSMQAQLGGIGVLLENIGLPALFVGPTLWLFAIVVLLLIGLVLARIIFGIAIKIIMIAAGVVLGLFLFRLLSSIVL